MRILVELNHTPPVISGGPIPDGAISCIYRSTFTDPPPPPVRWSATRRLSRTAVRHSCTYTTTQKDGGPATFISQGQQVKVARPEVRKAHQIMAADRQETCCASVRNKRPCELLRCRAGPIWRPTPSLTLNWIAKANSSN